MLLKRGDNNENVKKLQIQLKIDPVGNFGPKTEAAVKEFQKKHGLKVDGIVGEETWRKIMRIESDSKQPNILVVTDTPNITPTVKKITPQLTKVPVNQFGINISKLKGVIPDNVLEQIPNTMKTFEINTPLRLAHFLSQCGHESGGFRFIVENLNYSVKGLMTTFKKYFPTESLAKKYERNPEKIANKVYANRMQNGNEASGDGYRFRGRGYIQLTGKANYIEFGKVIKEDLTKNSDLVSIKYPLLSAGWFFYTNKIHKIADGGSSRVVIENVTRRVNGGLNGIEDRVNRFNQYYKLLV
jgi:putative chitinase